MDGYFSVQDITIPEMNFQFCLRLSIIQAILKDIMFLLDASNFCINCLEFILGEWPVVRIKYLFVYFDYLALNVAIMICKLLVILS